jgi:hypothetical protein
MKKTATRVPKSNRKVLLMKNRKVLLMINRKNAVHVWEKDEIKKQKARARERTKIKEERF